MGDETRGRVLGGRLSTVKVVVMVVAAAAPMAAVIGTVPLTFLLGSGSATPAMYVVAGVTLLLFSVGYAAIARRFSAAGGFYTYIAKGLGRPPAAAGALVAVVAYNALVLLVISGVGYFGNLVLANVTGVDVPWWLLSLAGVAVTALLGYRSIDVAGKVLGVMLVLEIGLLVVFDVAVVAHEGLAAFPLAAVNPVNAFTVGSVGIGLMFAFQSFIGFESAAIYAEETTHSRRSIPRATYAAVLVISVFYGLTSWVTVGALGPDGVTSAAASAQGTLFFGLSDRLAGGLLTLLMSITIVTSMFASQVAAHSVATRYMFAVGRERLLPSWLGVPHPRRRTPSRASAAQTGVSLAGLAIFAGAGLDPYLTMATAMSGLSALGLILLQAGAAAAIVAYFRRHRRGVSVLTLAGPAVAGVVMAVVAVLIVVNLKTLLGATSDLVYIIPVLLLGFAAGGALQALWLRARRPADYARIGVFDGTVAEPAPVEELVGAR